MPEILSKSEQMSRWVRYNSQTTILALTTPNTILANRGIVFPRFFQIIGSEQKSSRNPGFVSFGFAKTRIDCDHSGSRSRVRPFFPALSTPVTSAP
jgi:hypothetical protein